METYSLFVLHSDFKEYKALLYKLTTAHLGQNENHNAYGS